LYKFFISLRYVRSRIVIMLALLAVLVSVMAFVVIMAVLQGFGEHLREGIRRMNAHVDIRRRFFLEIEDYKGIAAKVGALDGLKEMAGTKGVLPYVGGPIVIQTRRYRAYRMVKGVRLAEERKFADLDNVLNTESFKPPNPDDDGYGGIILGKHFMEEVELVKGSMAWLTAQGQSEEKARKKAFIVVGRADTGSNWFDQIFTLIDFKEAQELFNYPNGASGLSVWLEDSSEENTVKVADRIDVMLNGVWDIETVRKAVGQATHDAELAAAVAKRLETRTYRDSPSNIAAELARTPDEATVLADVLSDHIGQEYIIKPWFEQREDIFKAIKMQTLVMRVILVMYLLVMGVSVFVILWTIVAEKTRDIGLLRAIGARKGGVVAIFLGTGMLIGVIGAALGLGLGILLARNVDVFAPLLGLGRVSQDLFGLNKLPCRIEAADLALAVLATVMMSVAASALPAWRAARVDPVESLRHE